MSAERSRQEGSWKDLHNSQSQGQCERRAAEAGRVTRCGQRAQDAVTPALSGPPRSPSTWGPLAAPLQALGMGLGIRPARLSSSAGCALLEGPPAGSRRGLVWEPAFLSSLTTVLLALFSRSAVSHSL